MRFRARPILGCVVLFCLAAGLFPNHSSAQGVTSTPLPTETGRQQLLSLFDEQWQYRLRSNPEWATTLGDNRYNDRLSDNSPEFFQADLEEQRKFLTRFEA